MVQFAEQLTKEINGSEDIYSRSCSSTRTIVLLHSPARDSGY